MGGGVNSNFNLMKLGSGQQIDISKLKEGVKQTKENEAIFKTFDKNNNGILEKGELDALKQSLIGYNDDLQLTNEEAAELLKNAGAEDANIQEFFDFLKNAQAYSENIEDCFYSVFDNQEAVNVKYKKDENGIVKTSSFNKETGAKIQDNYDNGSINRTVYYDADGNAASEEIKEGAKTTLKDAQGRVTKETIDKGNGLSEVVEYKYEGDSTTPSETITTKMDGTVVRSGSGKEADETQQAQNKNHEYNVQSGDTWYGIVQAKYKITDHKTTMEIVHQLKTLNNVDFKHTNIPKTITLPDSIKLNDGREVKMQDIKAEADKKHWGPAAAGSTTPETKTEAPSETPETEVENPSAPSETPEGKADGTEVKSAKTETYNRKLSDGSDSTWIDEYDANGNKIRTTIKVNDGSSIEVYDYKDGKLAKGKGINYQADGKTVKNTFDIEYDSSGNRVKDTLKRSDGTVYETHVYRDGKLVKGTRYDADGKTIRATCDIEYDGDKQSKETWKRGDGTLSSVRKYQDGKVVKLTKYAKDGRTETLIEENGVRVLQRLKSKTANGSTVTHTFNFENGVCTKSTLADTLKTQIGGPSLNKNTIALLKQLTPENVIKVLTSYKQTAGETLQDAIKAEWGMGQADVDQYITQVLNQRIKDLGLDPSKEYSLEELAKIDSQH